MADFIDDGFVDCLDGQWSRTVIVILNDAIHVTGVVIIDIEDSRTQAWINECCDLKSLDAVSGRFEGELEAAAVLNAPIIGNVDELDHQDRAWWDGGFLNAPNDLVAVIELDGRGKVLDGEFDEAVECYVDQCADGVFTAIMFVVDVERWISDD